MVVLPDTSTRNVESTITDYFAARLQDVMLPAYLPTVQYIYNWPDIESSLPCFSFNHLSPSTSEVAAGRVATVGQSVTRKNTQLEINAWVSKDESNYWAAQLNFMQSMVDYAYQVTPTIVIRDYLANPSMPDDTPYLIRLDGLQTPVTAPNPNTAIMRRRMLISYWWHSRQAV